MPVSRDWRKGWSCGDAFSWVRISGDVLISAQFCESLLIAIEDWVRHLILTDWSRAPRQLRQLQFHCGIPPPAAEPRTSTFIYQFFSEIAAGLIHLYYVVSDIRSRRSVQTA
jgi:hypothetical protein